MKYLLATLALTLPHLAIAGLSECGEYEVRGVVRARTTAHEIVVNEKTMSEMDISLPITERLKLAPYVDRPMSAVLVLNKKFDGTKGQSEKIISIKTRIPDPLKPDDTGLSLLKKLDCVKN